MLEDPPPLDWTCNYPFRDRPFGAFSLDNWLILTAHRAPAASQPLACLSRKPDLPLSMYAAALLFDAFRLTKKAVGKAGSQPAKENAFKKRARCYLSCHAGRKNA